MSAGRLRDVLGMSNRRPTASNRAFTIQIKIIRVAGTSFHTGCSAQPLSWLPRNLGLRRISISVFRSKQQLYSGCFEHNHAGLLLGQVKYTVDNSFCGDEHIRRYPTQCNWNKLGPPFRQTYVLPAWFALQRNRFQKTEKLRKNSDLLQLLHLRFQTYFKSNSLMFFCNTDLWISTHIMTYRKMGWVRSAGVRPITDTFSYKLMARVLFSGFRSSEWFSINRR